MAGSSRRATRSRFKPPDDEDNGEDSNSSSNRKSSSIQKTRRSSRDHHGGPLRIINVNLKTLLSFGVLAFLIATFIIFNLMRPTVEEAQKLRVITPFPAPKLMDLPQFQGEHKEGLYWGTYRPHVYLGVRARTPQSLIAGLMWIGVKDGRYFMRHVCQDSDGLSMYGWTHHNGRDYGQQLVVDQDLTLRTSFLKSKADGSGYGGDWAIRVTAQQEKERSASDEEVLETGHLFFYVADEEGNGISIGRERLDIHDGSLLASGSRKDVENWELHLDSKDNPEVHYAGFRTPHINNLSDLVQATLGANARKVGRLQLPDLSDQTPNILVFQISAKFPCTVDIAFLSGTGLKNSRIEERVKSLTGNQLTSHFNEKQKSLENKYKERFNLTDKVDSQSSIVGMAAIGNMLGGIGYFYGQSKIALPKDFSVSIEESPNMVKNIKDDLHNLQPFFLILFKNI